MRLIFRPNPRFGYELTLGTSISVGDSGPSPGDSGMGLSGNGREIFLLSPILPAAREFDELNELNERRGEGEGAGESRGESILIRRSERERAKKGRRRRKGSAEALRRRGRISPKVEEQGGGRRDSIDGREWDNWLLWPSRLGGELRGVLKSKGRGEASSRCALGEPRGRSGLGERWKLDESSERRGGSSSSEARYCVEVRGVDVPSGNPSWPRTSEPTRHSTTSRPMWLRTA